MFHDCSIESLHHFHCGNCHRWWSIGDFKVVGDSQKLYCPHCGSVGEINAIGNNLLDTKR